MKTFNGSRAALPVWPRSASSVVTPHFVDPEISLVREYRECRARGAPISLLLCAPDDVRPAAPGVEAEVRSALLGGLRAEIPKYLLASEWLAPRGRDETMIVLPDMEAQAAQLVAQKIHRAAKSVASAYPDALMTVSIGIAVLAVGPCSGALMPADLLRACKRSLAESRRRGGDCITTTAVQWLL